MIRDGWRHGRPRAQPATDEKTTRCSILATLDLPGDADAYRARALRLSRLQRHRGPDWSGVDVCPGGVLVHERLAIVDPASASCEALPGTPLGAQRVLLRVGGERRDYGCDVSFVP